MAPSFPPAFSFRVGRRSMAPASSAASKIWRRTVTVFCWALFPRDARVAMTAATSSEVISRSSFPPMTGQITLLIWYCFCRRLFSLMPGAFRAYQPAAYS